MSNPIAPSGKVLLCAVLAFVFAGVLSVVLSTRFASYGEAGFFAVGGLLNILASGWNGRRIAKELQHRDEVFRWVWGRLDRRGTELLYQGIGAILILGALVVCARTAF